MIDARHKAPFLVAALRRTYGDRVATMRITARTPIRMLSGIRISLGRYAYDPDTEPDTEDD